jgi:peptidoglycan/xylan/chitin deacetylase (PgdA/CDA1 family)
MCQPIPPRGWIFSIFNVIYKATISVKINKFGMAIERRTFLKYAAVALISPFTVLKALGNQTAKANEFPKELVCPIHYWHEVNDELEFEKYIFDLIQADYFPITLSGIAEYFDSGIAIWPKNKNPMAITFDDGLLSQFLNAEPVLERWMVAATFAVMPNFWGDKDHKYMDNNQIRKIAKNREIASHTLSHFSYLPEKRLTDPISWREEIIDSKFKLEDIIGKKVVSFVYPYGKFNLATVDGKFDMATADLVQENYKIAVKTGGSSLLKASERFYLPRCRSIS